MASVKSAPEKLEPKLKYVSDRLALVKSAPEKLETAFSLLKSEPFKSASVRLASVKSAPEKLEP